MGVIEARLGVLVLELPAPLAAPSGVRLPFERVRFHGGLAYVSGHGPFDGDPAARHRASRRRGLRRAGLRGRACDGPVDSRLAQQELNDLDRVAGWIKALGFVKCAEGFNVTPAAINGFSDLILTLWGDAGRHARSAIGAGELPFGMPVEVEAAALA